MGKFKEIPENTKVIYCDRWGCGAECCDMNYLYICANYLHEGKLKGVVLWESNDFHTDDAHEYVDEINEAFKFYGLEIPENIWDYEFVRRTL
jgi:hypothetical protein